ncbi:hypothetical protein ELQ26_04440 [Neisseria meningitidis]|nr:hypothetical protein [Neisseria meningitidis]MBG8594120.1 hypothetical protein [Neisseria meningitidis]MBG8609669.1 hypothetical protein [Neisseria meningitidis]MBG8620152.1 hypothetical protein [Neisseria meningitidis]MBG8651439.1 hypothetical protein [Neisseria meningitidis]
MLIHYNISILGTTHKASPDEGCRGGIIRDFREKYGSRTKEFDEMPRFPNKDCRKTKKPSFENSAFFVLSGGS